jgi:hypothetical protein
MKNFAWLVLLLFACNHQSPTDAIESSGIAEELDKKFPITFKEDTVRFKIPDSYILYERFSDIDFATYIFVQEKDSDYTFFRFGDNKYIRITLFEQRPNIQYGKAIKFPNAHNDVESSIHSRCENYIYDSMLLYKEFKYPDEYWINLLVSSTGSLQIHSNDYQIENNIIDEIRDIRN